MSNDRPQVLVKALLGLTSLVLVTACGDSSGNQNKGTGTAPTPARASVPASMPDRKPPATPASIPVAVTTPAVAPVRASATVPAVAPAAPTTASATAAVVPSALPDDLKKAIDDAIALLKAGKYEEVTNMLAGPTIIEQARAGNRLEEIYARIQSMAPDLINALENAKTSIPTINGDGYEFPANGQSPPLRFRFDEGAWRIK